MNKIFPLSLFIGLIMSCCSDPNTIGLEVQPMSDNIIISDLNSFNWQTSKTMSEDYLRTDESVNLILGEIMSDEIFLNNIGSFYTQILLTQNNIDLGNNPIVDSVVLSYTYNNYYGDLQEFEEVEVIELSESLYKDSTYYSNLEIVNPSSPINLVESFSLNNDDQNPVFKIRLQNLIGQKMGFLEDALNAPPLLLHKNRLHTLSAQQLFPVPEDFLRHSSQCHQMLGLYYSQRILIQLHRCHHHKQYRMKYKTRPLNLGLEPQHYIFHHHLLKLRFHLILIFPLALIKVRYLGKRFF